MRSLVFLPLALGLTACQTGLTAIGNEGFDTGPEVEVPSGTDADTDTDADTPPDNNAPEADAGFPQQVESGQVVLLDGSGSYDADGDELTYAWTFASRPQGSAAELLNDFRVDPQFYADVAGVYEVELTVDDGIDTAADTVTITVTDPNGVPTANAGPDQSVSATSSVQLNGGNSTDPDGDALNYTWQFISKPSGSGAILNGPTTSTPYFVADLAGSYVVSLVVDDGVLTSSPDQVSITATSSGGSSGGGDCGSCGAYVERTVRTRTQTGRAASALGLFTLPFVLLFWQRRRD